MTENLFTIFYGKYGNRPLKKELPRILKLINDEKIENIDLKIGLVNYVVRRAARLEIKIDYRYFEKVFLEIMAKTKKNESYGDTCFAFAYYFYRNKIHPKKALFYLKESIRYPQGEWYLYSRFILFSYFYYYGFGVKKDLKQVIRYISATNRILFHGGGIVECNIRIDYKPIKFDVRKDRHYCY